jgi:hypothetical protein
MNSLTPEELNEMFSEVEKLDLLVKKVRMNSETLRGLKRNFAKQGNNVKRKIWKAELTGSHDIYPPHVWLTASDGVETRFCRVHNQDSQLCPECSVEDVMTR